MHVRLIRSRAHCEILEAAEEGPGHASVFALRASGTCRENSVFWVTKLKPLFSCCVML